MPAPPTRVARWPLVTFRVPLLVIGRYESVVVDDVAGSVTSTVPPAPFSKLFALPLGLKSGSAVVRIVQVPVLTTLLSPA